MHTDYTTEIMQIVFKALKYPPVYRESMLLATTMKSYFGKVVWQNLPRQWLQRIGMQRASAEWLRCLTHSFTHPFTARYCASDSFSWWYVGGATCHGNKQNTFSSSWRQLCRCHDGWRKVHQRTAASQQLHVVYLSLHGILFLCVAVSTIERQCSRENAFFHG